MTGRTLAWRITPSAIACLACLGTSHPMWAEDNAFLATGGSETVLRSLAATESKDGYQEGVQKLFLRAAGGPWEMMLEARGVAVGPRDEDGEPPVRLLGPDLTGFVSDTTWLGLEKIAIRHHREHLELTLGDFSAALGRGTALNMLRNADLDLDTTLLGLRLKAHTSWGEAELLSGLAHPQTVSLLLPNKSLQGPPRDTISALHLTARPLPQLRLQAWGSSFHFEDTDMPPEGVQSGVLEPDAMVLGGAVELLELGGVVDAWLEANRFRYLDEERFSEVAPDGLALYLSSTAWLGPYTLLLEAKRYQNAEAINVRSATWRYEYVTPPTLEPADAVTRDSAETINSADLAGFHLRLDRRVESLNSLFTLNWGQFYDLAPVAPTPSKENIFHLYGGWELTPQVGGRLALSGGYRLELRSVRSDGQDATMHARVDLEAPALGPVSPTLHLLGKRFVETTDTGGYSFTEGEISLGLTFRGVLAALLRWQYTDDPVVLNNAWLGGGPGNLSERQFGSVQLEWRPTGRTGVRLFAGARRAGLECAAGQCRFMPAFEGLELSGRLSF